MTFATQAAHSETKKRPHTLNAANHSIQFYDENSLPLNMLLKLIHEHLDISCHCSSLDTSNIDVDDLQQHKLLLINVGTQSIDDINKLLSQLAEAEQTISVGLFNVEYFSEAEKLIIWPNIHGFLYTDISAELFIKSVKELLDDGTWFSRRIINSYLHHHREAPSKQLFDTHDLTTREAQILDFLTEGSTNAEIGDQLNISEHTIRSHLYHIFKKIGVRNRTEASAWLQQRY